MLGNFGEVYSVSYKTYARCSVSTLDGLSQFGIRLGDLSLFIFLNDVGVIIKVLFLYLFLSFLFLFFLDLIRFYYYYYFFSFFSFFSFFCGGGHLTEHVRLSQ